MNFTDNTTDKDPGDKTTPDHFYNITTETTMLLTKGDYYQGMVTNTTTNLSAIFGNNTAQDVLWSPSVCGSNSSDAWKLTTPICSTRFESFFVFVLVTLLLTLTIIITLVGNFMVLLALYRYRSLQTMSNCLIGNLAVSDLAISLLVLPISTGNDMLGYWVFGETMCTIWLCIDVLICTASIWGLCTIAFDRYTATVYPVWYHDKRSRKKALLYVSFVWIFSIVISFSPFIGWRDMIPSFYSHNDVLNRYECILFSTKSYVVYSAMGSFVLPLLLMTFLYIRIFIVLHKQSKTLKAKANLYYAQKNSTPNNRGHGGIERSVTRETNLDGNASQNAGSFYLEDMDETSMMETSVIITGQETVTDLSCRNSLLPIRENSPTYSKVDSSESDSDLSPKHEPKTNGLSNNNHMLPKSQSDINVIHNKISCDENGLLAESKRSKSANILSDSNLRQKSPSSSPAPKLARNNRMTLSMKRRFELREQRATKRMLTIMACFCVCWIPFLVMYLTRSFCMDCYMNEHIVSFIIWLGYANSCLNPILYTVFNEDFRRAFKKILHMDKKPRR
ncbi:octopamine receptor 2 [Patella vulgata]|uniref:octopamine receptor 2 n=1 Tax=Patella vulgata TaxID=6465 RepID=UPI00217FA0BC|nr:octopamine receptor 2 [Patella vulgata]XP_050397805.1 octopamine receptor 2 [Patella vulgata]